MSKRFVHLHTHTHYSLLQALPKVPDMVKKAKEYGMDALAITDNGNLYGAIEFTKECTNPKIGIKPIIGVDFFVATRTRHDKEPRIDHRSKKLVLIAKDQVGYENLKKLVTLSNFEGFYYKPRIDKELIEKYKDGLIAILPSFGGEAAAHARTGNIDEAKKVVEYYKSVFGGSTDPNESNVFVEVTRHDDLEEHKMTMDRMATVAEETGVPLVGAHNIFYLTPDDKKARTTLLSVQKIGSGPVEDDEGDFSFKSADEMYEMLKEYKGACENTGIIADRCTLEIVLGKWVFPKIDVDEEFKDSPTPYDDHLKKIVYAGFERRKVEKSEEVVKRVEYELSVIKTKGYAPYFLVVADLLKYARENNILSNIRGSVSGSMVTYLSGITNIDPLEYEIPFERFLNPDRPSAPDIDMDYADNRRDEMVAYARRKYGNDKVAQIGTFGTMAARGSVRDVTRALGYHHSLGDQIAKLIPMGKQGFPMTIELALSTVPELKELYNSNADVKKIIDMAEKIEGCARHMGIHAAGVVISPTEITDYTPLQFDPKGENKIITQYDMYSIEDAGLLKFDFLGLKNLSIIADAIEIAEARNRDTGLKIDLDTIPLDDAKTFEMLKRGETEDLFQLNGDGMTRFLMELKPTSIHDINAMVALYRPGPLQFIPDYIERKQDPTKIPDMDPAVYEILKKTFGVLVYQDDLLMMAHKLAGYSWGEVDKFRKAVGKKIPEEMALQRDKFIKGCMEHSGWEKSRAEEVWTKIEPFASYGFNKAHSVSYGRVAYITAYLKANWPAEYMSAVLTHEAGDVDKVAISVHECERMGIKVLPPNVNESFGNFGVVAEKTIRFGLFSIKNFGEGIGAAIIKERKQNGKFKNLEDFLNRVKDRNLNKKSLESLIKSGAMDEYGDRGVMLANIQDMLDYNRERTRLPDNQDSLFGALGGIDAVQHLKLKDAEKAKQSEKLLWEKELLGLYISGHPLDQFDEKAKEYVPIGKIHKVVARDVEEFELRQMKKAHEEENRLRMINERNIQNGLPSKTIEEMKAEIEEKAKNAPKKRFSKEELRKQLEESRPKERMANILGIIEEVKEITTKKDASVRMMFLKVTDKTGSIEVVVFPKMYDRFKEKIKVDTCVIIRGRTSSRNGVASLMLENILPLK
ncbi:MAG: DNA polymerase III subunit alpha [Candidatus Taylorbacteria bacterium]|nr:DNA polymerase III subunit alpha [Candidatus Taylorbacteria bacterium]